MLIIFLDDKYFSLHFLLSIVIAAAIFWFSKYFLSIISFSTFSLYFHVVCSFIDIFIFRRELSRSHWWGLSFRHWCFFHLMPLILFRNIFMKRHFIFHYFFFFFSFLSPAIDDYFRIICSRWLASHCWLIDVSLFCHDVKMISFLRCRLSIFRFLRCRFDYFSHFSFFAACKYFLLMPMPPKPGRIFMPMFFLLRLFCRHFFRLIFRHAGFEFLFLNDYYFDFLPFLLRRFRLFSFLSSDISADFLMLHFISFAPGAAWFLFDFFGLSPGLHFVADSFAIIADVIFVTFPFRLPGPMM